MKKYLSLAMALMLAASISACGTAKNVSSAAETEQTVETEAEKEQTAETAAEQPANSTQNVTEDQKDSSASKKAAEEEKPDASDNAAPEEDPESENIPDSSWGAAAAEIPEEAQNEAGEETIAETSVYLENLSPEGVEVNIEEDAIYGTADEEISTPPEVAGTYTLYAWDEGGNIMKPEDQNVTSAITLEEDGTGIMTFNDDSSVITRWGVSGTLFAMFYDEHGAADGTLDDGIIIIDPVDGDDNLYFYGKEGVDISKVLEAGRENYILED